MTRHLPEPIRDTVEVRLSEAEISRGWSRVRSQIRSRRGRTRNFTAVWRPSLLVAGGLAAATALAWLFVRPGEVEPRALSRADGSPLTELRADHDTDLSDGSRIRVLADTELEILDNQPERFLVVLERGRARFEVSPETRRTWTVEAALASVEVRGTVFEVTRAPDAVTVTVERGRVLVRSDRLPHRVRSLGAGGSVTIRAGEEHEESAGVREDVRRDHAEPIRPEEPALRSADNHRAMAEESSFEPADRQVAGPTDPAATSGPERSTTARSATDGFPGLPSAPDYLPAGPDGLGTAEPTERADARPDRVEPVSDLLLRADEAWSSGRRTEALALLERAGADSGGAAGIALVTRGRRLLELNRTSEAARDLARARMLALPPSLDQLALALLVQTTARQGDRAAAEQAAAEYERRYPGGSFEETNRRWLERASR